MKITRDNCEAYFLDYHEGTLSPEMAAEVLLFVELNPEFRTSFEGFETITLSDDFQLFDNKNSLKQAIDFSSTSINSKNIDEFLIAEVEGLLSIETLAALDTFLLNNPQFAHSRKLYSLTLLKPDSEDVFSAKSLLHKQSIPVGLVTSDTIDTFLVKELESDIEANEKLELEEYLKYNPEAIKSRGLYARTVLQADLNMVFPAKANLKRTIALPRKTFYSVFSVAASIALLIGFYIMMYTNPTPKDNNVINPISEVQSPEIKTTTPETKKSIELALNTDASKTSSSTLLTNSLDHAKRKQASSDTQNNSIRNNDAVQTVGVERISGDIAYVQPIFVSNMQSSSYVDSKYMFIRMSAMYVNQYNEYYYNLKLADELQYAQYNSKDRNPERTIYNAFASNAENRFASLLNKPQRETAPVNGWSFAELGVKTYNAITGSEVELKLQKDEDGQVMSYGLESAVVNFERETRASKQK